MNLDDRGEVRRSEVEPLLPLRQPTDEAPGRGARKSGLGCETVGGWLVHLLGQLELQPQPVAIPVGSCRRRTASIRGGRGVISGCTGGCRLWVDVADARRR